jgi:hypothetical protein
MVALDESLPGAARAEDRLRGAAGHPDALAG